MNIFTESIKDELELQLNKDISEITQEELFNVKTITINRLGFGDEIREVKYEEISFFDNLEELTISNCMINNELMNNILKLKKIKKIKIYNCDFVDLPQNMFDSLHLSELVISNCLGLSNTELRGLVYLELKNVKMDFLINNVGILNISNINEKLNIDNLKNIKRIIISEKDYYKNEKLNNLCSYIVVVNDKMGIVEEIKYDKD